MDQEFTVNMGLLKAVKIAASNEELHGSIAKVQAIHGNQGPTPLYSQPIYCATNQYIAAIGTAHADLDDPQELCKAYIDRVDGPKTLISTETIDQYVRLAPKGAVNIANYVKQTRVTFSDDDSGFTLRTGNGVLLSEKKAYVGDFPNMTPYFNVNQPAAASDFAVSVENLDKMLKMCKAVGATAPMYHGAISRRADTKLNLSPQYWSISEGGVLMVMLTMPLKVKRGWQ